MSNFPMERRTFLRGLIATPFIVKYTSLMPMGRGIPIIGGDLWWVIDVPSGLKLRLSTAEICGPNAHRYQPAFDMVERPLLHQAKIAMEFRKDLEWQNGVLVPRRLAQGEKLPGSFMRMERPSNYKSTLWDGVDLDAE